MGEERGFKWLWTWNGCWCQIGWSWLAVVWMKMPCWCQRSEENGRLVRDDRKTTVTQIATRYNKDMQNTISEHTTRRTLKQMGYSSRRPHRVPLLSDKNRTRRLQFTQNHQNWTIEDCKNVAWSDESWFLDSDGRVIIWCKEHESMDPSCLVSMVQAGGDGVMVWGDIFLAHFGPLSTNWASFKRHSLPEYCCWPCPSLYDYSVPIFWWYFQQDNAPCHKAQIISDWFLEHDNWVHFTQMASTVTRSQSKSTFGMWWNGRFASWMCSRQICSNCVMLSYQYGPKSLRNVSNTLLNLCHEELSQFWRQKGVQPVTSKVYLIKWPVSV